MHRFAYMIIFTWFINCIHIIHCVWIQSAVQLPRSADEGAVGSNGNEVYIFGGYQNPRQILRYNVINDTFTDDGDVLPFDTKGNAQFYQQYANMLYMITDNKLSAYDFDSNQFINHWMNINFPIKLDIVSSISISCLVATNKFIFVIGGQIASVPTNNVQILNLSTYNWTFSYMIEPRYQLSCAFDHATNTLYAISGNEANPLDSIEMINITNIEQQSWIMLDDKLTIACFGTRALARRDYNAVFIIGGYASDDTSLYTVHIINTTTNQVSLSAEQLPYRVVTTAAIIVDNIMYCFGGWNYKGGKDNYLETFTYYIMASNEPTASPSKEPSASPTKEPSASPTIDTNPPTASPSKQSSASPTKEPSASPTKETTAAPTKEPSASTLLLVSELTAEATGDPYIGAVNITITCEGSNCHFDEDTVFVINNILIAHLDEEAHIIGINIMNDKVIIAIINVDLNPLEKDTISNQIKNELEDVYVTFDDADDDEDDEDDDDDDEDKKSNSNIIEFLSAVLPFSTAIIVCIVIGFVLFLIVITIVCVRVCCKKRKQAKMNQSMINETNQTTAAVTPKQTQAQEIQLGEAEESELDAEEVYNDVIDTVPLPVDKEEDSYKDEAMDVGRDSGHESLCDDVNVLAEGIRQKRRDSELMYVNNADAAPQTVGNMQNTKEMIGIMWMQSNKTAGNSKETSGNV